MNDYIQQTTIDGTNTGYITIADAAWGSSPIAGELHKTIASIQPKLYFKYVKKKLSFLEKRRIDSRLKKLEKAFYSAVDNGQEYLSEKILAQLAVETRQTLMFAKGIKMFVEKSDVDKYKHKIQGGHISDTQFKDYTRAIPASALRSKAKVEECFDGFVIYHYYDEKAIEKLEKKGEKLDPIEKAKMKDPILFGYIKENNRLYFIDEWEDEYCDLTFDELVDTLGKDESDITINRVPVLK